MAAEAAQRPLRVRKIPGPFAELSCCLTDLASLVVDRGRCQESQVSRQTQDDEALQEEASRVAPETPLEDSDASETIRRAKLQPSQAKKFGLTSGYNVKVLPGHLLGQGRTNAGSEAKKASCSAAWASHLRRSLPQGQYTSDFAGIIGALRPPRGSRWGKEVYLAGEDGGNREKAHPVGEDRGDQDKVPPEPASPSSPKSPSRVRKKKSTGSKTARLSMQENNDGDPSSPISPRSSVKQPRSRTGSASEEGSPTRKSSSSASARASINQAEDQKEGTDRAATTTNALLCSAAAALSTTPAIPARLIYKRQADLSVQLLTSIYDGNSRPCLRPPSRAGHRPSGRGRSEAWKQKKCF
eukprot:TRINITY_DN63712_c0_g1_i1.p1 TRINITY_DN63712_c0_g1~~TRINITY_DN63712_c0_g1_i1.p1  ORF type:complete len:387 (-),score=44.88 TRINITY_DN63712_c0_g1_i1:174-1238(-)